MGQLVAIGCVGPKRGVGDEPGEWLTAAPDVDTVGLALQVSGNDDIVPDASLVWESVVAVVDRTIPSIDRAIRGEANQDRSVGKGVDGLGCNR
jgi:hypothetical protein